jgi:hypothetical protein
MDGVPAVRRRALRSAVIAVLALGIGLAIGQVKRRFEAKNERAAIDLVMGWHTPSGKSIADAIASQDPDAPAPVWSATTESACWNHERVRAEIRDAPASLVYEFVVDINAGSIHPGNENGERALRELGL